ncbi:MAG: adenylyltransferase/cytidyltransferase family protein [Nanoarchaeota archaeon]|nr:adenylyltransferase/cytidyltransferase family protein [Nanoarchaeota archaeon]
MNVGLFIGRFQPFHKGHASVIEYALKQCDKLIILIGSPKQYGKEYNPFTLDQRKKMIKLALPKKVLEKCEITEVIDYGNNKKWVNAVEKNKFNTVFTNNPHVEKCLKKHEIRNIPITVHCNATEVRRKMYLDQNWKECVPTKVMEYLEKINAQKTMKKIINN